MIRSDSGALVKWISGLIKEAPKSLLAPSDMWEHMSMNLEGSR